MPDENLGLLTPDTASGIALGVAASMVTALQENVKGWHMLISNAAAALVTGVAMPIAIKHGFTWGDWLGIICLGCGVTAGGMFMFLRAVRDRFISRAAEAGDGLFTRTFAFLLSKKDAPK